MAAALVSCTTFFLTPLDMARPDDNKQALKIEWLESTLAFTREKIQLEDVLGHLLRDLAEMTTRVRADEQKLGRLVAQSDALLEAMRTEAWASRRAKARIEGLNRMLLAAEEERREKH